MATLCDKPWPTSGSRSVRVSNKASHDYAEVFDGVPSQHDGKDAAVVAELAALGKCQPWAYEPASALGAGIELLGGMDGGPPPDPGDLAGAAGRAGVAALAGGDPGAEALLGDVAAGAWSSTGDPKALASGSGGDAAAGPLGRIVPGTGEGSSGCWPMRARAWVCGSGNGSGGRSRITPGRPWRRGRRLSGRSGGCGTGRGPRGAPGPGQGGGRADGVCLVDQHGRPAEVSCGRRLPQGDGVELGGAEQRDLPGAAADQQAGQCADAAMALFRGVAAGADECGVRPWYEAKKARNEGDARRVVVAVMRKLAVALYHVGVQDEEFQPRRLFGRIGRGCGRPEPPHSGTRSRRQAQEGSAPGTRATVS